MSGKGIFRGNVQGQIVQGGNVRGKLSDGEDLWRGNIRLNVRISVQLRAAVVTFVTLVNTHTHAALADQLAQL